MKDIVALIVQMGEPDDFARGEAITLLAEFDPPPIDDLAPALLNSDGRIRSGPALVLKKLGPNAASMTANLLNLLSDPDRDVRECAAQALGTIGLAAVPSLACALASDDRLALIGALKAIGEIGTEADQAVDQV